jgi:hypothetical protein
MSSQMFHHVVWWNIFFPSLLTYQCHPPFHSKLQFLPAPYCWRMAALWIIESFTISLNILVSLRSLSRAFLSALPWHSYLSVWNWGIFLRNFSKHLVLTWRWGQPVPQKIEEISTRLYVFLSSVSTLRTEQYVSTKRRLSCIKLSIYPQIPVPTFETFVLTVIL